VIKIQDISLLIDRLERLLRDSRSVPLTSGAIVNRDECLVVVDQIRVTIPQQIAEARRIQHERDQIIARAEQEAQMIMERAAEEAESVLNEQGLMQEVQDRSAVVADEARRKAEETMRGADEYAIRVLGELEDQLVALQTTIRNGLEILQQDGRMARLAEETGLEELAPESDTEER
jgi:bifunctional DNA-binding transcriptional regulator/antitoxin component of YhaV-PrlF toxin-antitoxin module